MGGGGGTHTMGGGGGGWQHGTRNHICLIFLSICIAFWQRSFRYLVFIYVYYTWLLRDFYHSFFQCVKLPVFPEAVHKRPCSWPDGSEFPDAPLGAAWLECSLCSFDWFSQLLRIATSVLHLSSDQNPGCLEYKRGYTTQFCRDYNKPLQGSL